MCGPLLLLRGQGKQPRHRPQSSPEKGLDRSQQRRLGQFGLDPAKEHRHPGLDETPILHRVFLQEIKNSGILLFL